MSSPLGSILAGPFGYRSTPTPLEIMAYFAYLIPVLILFLKPGRRDVLGGPAAAATSLLLLASIVAGCGSSAASSPTESGIPGAIRITASEYKFDPATVQAPSGGTTFELVNAGTTEHELELFQAGKLIGTIKGIAPKQTSHMTVDLTPGDYTYVCRLAGHDSLGMKGALSVTGG